MTEWTPHSVGFTVNLGNLGLNSFSNYSLPMLFSNPRAATATVVVPSILLAAVPHSRKVGGREDSKEGQEGQERGRGQQ